MGVALQCPECGFKHRLDAIGDRAVFSCARCSRELKVPAEYRAAAAPATNGTGASPAVKGAARARPSPPPHPKHRVGAAPMRLPVRILLWVVALVLGALVVRFLAKATGFAGGNTFFDLLIDGSVGTYLRLFALVPVWALFSTLFATAFIDGPRAWARHQAGAASTPSGSAAATRRPQETSGRPPAKAGAGVAAGAAATGATRSRERSIPRREPAPVATPGPRPPSAPSRLPDPPPVAPAVTRTSAVPLAGAAATASSGGADDAASDFTERAAAGQRPRRIPRRGAGS